jgi:hypothetical protein
MRLSDFGVDRHVNDSNGRTKKEKEAKKAQKG